MIHCFDANLAKEFGIEEAIFIDKLVGWIQYNRANGLNYHDGKTWTFNSARAYADIFPYMTPSKIKRAIANLVEKGVVVKGNYNENQYDRTCWYSFTEEGLALVQNYYFHCSKMTNGKVQNEPTIPNNQPIYQPNNNTISFTPSDEGSDGGLFDDSDTSTLTMLSSENLPPMAKPATPTAEEFEDLWLMYERKGSKAKAKQEFAKLTAEEIATMRCHIPAYIQSRPERQYRQDFERYIKHKTFLSVVYSKNNEVLYDPESSTATPLPEMKEQNYTININGTIYR